MGCYGVFLILCQVILVFLGQPGRCRWIASRTDRDAKNARNEKRNEMNAKSEFAPGRSERWRHPEPRQPAWAAGSSSSSRGREGTKHPESWLTPSGTLRFYSSASANESMCNSIDPATVINDRWCKEYWKSILKHEYCYTAKILLSYKQKYWCKKYPLAKEQSIHLTNYSEY